MPIRILVADDHKVVRAGVRALLQDDPNLIVVGEAANGHETLRLATELRPDVVLLDITMPGPDDNGIEVTRRLRKLLPETRVLILTLHEDVSLLREAIHAGASGYIIKRTVDRELIAAIRAVQRGDLYVHPDMTQALLKDMSPLGSSRKQDAIQLSRREIEVLHLIVKGYTNRQIAEKLSLSTGTVNSHRASLMGKLGLHNRVELVRYATEHGLLEYPSHGPSA